jgi:hypothetical protein
MNSQENNSFKVKHLQRGSVYDPAKMISHIQVLVIYFLSFPTPPIKLKLQIDDGTLLINSSPPEAIKLFSQSIAAVKLLSLLFTSLSKLCQNG